MKVSFRLSDADREKYGGDEWVHFDDHLLADLGYDRLVELERYISRDGTSIAQIAAVEWPRMTVVGIRGMIWLARQLAGLTDPAWPDFKPDVLGSTFKLDDGDDADPPGGGSSEPPSEKTSPTKSARSKKR